MCAMIIGMSVSVDTDSYYCLGSITLAQTCSHRCHGIRPQYEKGKKNRVTVQSELETLTHIHISALLSFSLLFVKKDEANIRKFRRMTQWRWIQEDDIVELHTR